MTPTLEDHVERLNEVFTCMKQAGMKCKASKCEILRAYENLKPRNASPEAWCPPADMH